MKKLALFFLLAPLWGWGPSYSQTIGETINKTIEKLPEVLPSILNTNPQTSDDIQRLRNEVFNTFDLYERQLQLCRDSKETMRIISVKAMDEQLHELDRIKNAIIKQEASIAELQSMKLDLTDKLTKLQKTLRKVKRRETFMHVTYNSTIAVLAYFLIKDNLPP
jgi:hypothetical protein